MNEIVSVLLVVLAQAALPRVADTQAKANAQVLLKEGTAFYERGDVGAALAKFEAAYEIYPSPKLMFNIAQAERDLDRPVEALEAFQKFLAQVPEPTPEPLMPGKWSGAVASEARESVADLKGKLGQLKVECHTPGIEVLADGKSVGVTPFTRTVWMTAGRHGIAVRGRGNKPAIVKVFGVNVTKGMIQALTIEPRWLLAPPANVTVATQKVGSISSEIRFDLQISNDGGAAIPLSQVTVRYWYTCDAPSPVVAQTATCYYVYGLPRSCESTTIGNETNFVTVSPKKTKADFYFGFGFTAAAGDLAPGAVVKVGTGFHKNDLFGYTQTNDYSYDASASSKTVTVYLGGALVYGVEPM